MELKTEHYDDGSSFQAIDPLALNPEYMNRFSIYERSDKTDNQFRFRCLIKDPDSIPSDKLARLLESWEVVYIHEKQLNHYEKHIKENLSYILKRENLDIKRKTRAYIKGTSRIIKDIFDSHQQKVTVHPDEINRIEKLIEHVIDFIGDTESLNGLADLIGHDYDTHTHCVKVGWLMAVFGNANRDLFPQQNEQDFRDFLIKAVATGFLHDIGKTKIPDNILNKKGRLDNLEYLMIQSHTAYSLSMLYETELPEFSMRAILYHHENEDGSGYPCGLKNDQIPILAKTLRILDVFEALTSKRPYKDAKTPFQALCIMAGENPHTEILNQFEQEAKENKKAPVETIVRNGTDIKLAKLREKHMMEEEARKRVNARLKLRDQGMAHCFDRDLLRRFILTMNQCQSFDLPELL